MGNPDKGLMSLEEAARRVQQFVNAELPLVVTQVRPILVDTTCLCAGPSWHSNKYSAAHA